MTPFRPPYHTVAGNTLTIYINVVADSDSGFGPPIIDNILPKLAVEWNAIAIDNNLTLIFALGPDTAPPVVFPSNPPVIVPNAISVITGAVPPSGVNFFNFTVGRGNAAVRNTRSARVSYVNYRQGQGYIYQQPEPLAILGAEISHELGHVLGLSDRYYEAVFWLKDYAINMTCKEIRKGTWLAADGTDRRKGIPDPDPTLDPPIDTSVLPRLAVRASLPIRVAGEASFHNLMSDGSKSLTAAQVAIILAQDKEQTYRDKNWVAILGDWRAYPQVTTTPAWLPPGAPQPETSTQLGWLATRAPNLATGPLFLMPATEFNDPAKWRYPAREATEQEGGTGIVCGPPDHTALHQYGCLRSFHKGKAADKDVIQKVRVAVAMGRRKLVGLNGATSKNPIIANNPHWMCYARRMINDLL